MAKIIPKKPLLIILYGYPGAGKSHFATQFCREMQIAHIYGDRIRHELFDQPTHNKRENQIVEHLMQYMTEEFLRVGTSVIYDTDALTHADRVNLRNLAAKYKGGSAIVWLQVDMESAFLRIAKRDRRKTEDKYSSQYDRSTFDDIVKKMQNPRAEDYVVISGKHTFNAQKNAVLRKLYDTGLIDMDSTTAKVVKPQLVNLIPPVRGRQPETTRRNITIR